MPETHKQITCMPCMFIKMYNGTGYKTVYLVANQLHKRKYNSKISNSTYCANRIYYNTADTICQAYPYHGDSR